MTTQPDLMDLDVFAGDREMPVFDALRQESPIYWQDESHNGPAFWSLTRYDLVRDAAAHHERFSSAQGTQIVNRKVEGGGRASIHNMDDPEHAKLRAIATPHMRAVKMKEWHQVIDESVALLLDEARERGSFDLVETVSARLPMLVLSRVLGVPKDQAPKMVDWTNRMTSSDPDHQVDAASLGQARDELLACFEQLADERRKRPTNDLISVLANGQKDGKPLTREELAAYYIVLVAAGNETTRHTISGGIISLDATPRAWERLHADPALISPAVEEMLRTVTPVAAMRRTAKIDVDFHGAHIEQGDKVVLWFSAANRDPAVFEAPHEFRIDRTPNEHLAFGWGVHFCLGAHLARAELQAFFREVVRRKLSFSPDGAPKRVRHNLFRGWSSVPVKLVSA